MEGTFHDQFNVMLAEVLEPAALLVLYSTLLYSTLLLCYVHMCMCICVYTYIYIYIYIYALKIEAQKSDGSIPKSNYLHSYVTLLSPRYYTIVWEYTILCLYSYSMGVCPLLLHTIPTTLLSPRYYTLLYYTILQYNMI